MALRPAAADPFISPTVDVGSTFSDPNFGKGAKFTTEYDKFVDVTNPDVIKKMTEAKPSLGTRARTALQEQGYEMTKSGAFAIASDVISQFEQPQYEGGLPYNDPFANVDMTAFDVGIADPLSDVRAMPFQDTSTMAGYGGFSDFAQIQQNILNANFTNMYSQGYYGNPSLQAGLAMAYEELAG